MTEIKQISITKASPDASELLSDLQAMAGRGEIAAIGVYVVMADRSGYSDWCADHAVNIDTLAGGLQRVAHTIYDATGES